MVYDSVRQKVVLYGQETALPANRPQDTWLWDGTNWTNVTGTAGAPTAQYKFMMAFDGARGETVLFGGLCSNAFNPSCPYGPAWGALQETWTFNGTTWNKKTPVHSPPPSWDGPMAYDAVRGEVVLFGGNSGGCTPNNQTWTWNGVDWTLKTVVGAVPAAGAGGVMTYDAVRQRSILYGGLTNLCSSSSNFSSETWQWDGTGWTNLTGSVGTPPPARIFAGMAYDIRNNQVVLFGGEDGSGGPVANDTWLLGAAGTGSSPVWTQKTTPPPPASPLGRKW